MTDFQIRSAWFSDVQSPGVLPENMYDFSFWFEWDQQLDMFFPSNSVLNYEINIVSAFYHNSQFRYQGTFNIINMNAAFGQSGYNIYLPHSLPVGDYIFELNINVAGDNDQTFETDYTNNVLRREFTVSPAGESRIFIGQEVQRFIVEGNSRADWVPINFSRTIAVDSIDVRWHVEFDGSGTNPASADDLNRTSGVVNFRPGQFSASVDLRTAPDRNMEQNESFRFIIDNINELNASFYVDGTPNFQLIENFDRTFIITDDDFMSFISERDDYYVFPSAFSDYGLGSSNGVSGGSGNDTIIGLGSVQVIFGGPNDDTIDGRGGGDTISGDSGDDTIYYYASDLAANITGGAGTDTLLITNASSAPTSFNLTAQGFEQARLELVDTGNNTWATISQLFNVSWQMLTSNQVNDNGSRRFTSYDRANTQTWASSEEEYNTSGARYELRTYYDDNTRRTTGYDVNNAQTYGTYEEDYNAAGSRTALRTYYDDGTRRTTGYDTTGLNWTTYEEDYNAAGQRTALRTYYDDGTRRTTQWDPANGSNWSLIEEYFNAAGQRTRQITDYDDGNAARARLDTVWDVGNTQGWAVQTTQTNSIGAVVRVYGTMDNGAPFG